MIDQPQGFARDDFLELVFARAGARHIARAGLGGNMVPPVPAQRVIVDRKLSSRSLDRGARRQETLDPHAFGVITPLASASWRPLSSRHVFPREYTSTIKCHVQR